MAKSSDQQDCKIKITGSGITFERSVSITVAHQMMGIALGQAGAPSPGAAASVIPPAVNPLLGQPGQTIKTFVAGKKPKTDHERVACLAFYLTNFVQTPRFKTANITKAATDAAIDFSNLASAVNNATTKFKFLAKAGGGTKQITPRGEAIVNALPDRDKVTAVLKENPVRKRTGRKGKKAKKGA